MITGDLGLYGERLAVVLGFITFGLFVGMGMTCRTCVSFLDKVGLQRVTASRPYRALFRYHSIFWYGFFVALFLHALTGFMHTEFPKAGDPDAPLHTWILIFAGSLLVSVVLTFSNCRVFMGFVRVFRGDDVLKGLYGLFYQLHTYFWVLLFVVLVGHLAASYIHIGFWPTVIE